MTFLLQNVMNAKMCRKSLNEKGNKAKVSLKIGRTAGRQHNEEARPTTLYFSSTSESYLSKLLRYCHYTNKTVIGQRSFAEGVVG